MAKKTAEKPGRKNSYKEVYCYNWQIENCSLVAAALEFRAEVEAEVEDREKAKADAQLKLTGPRRKLQTERP